MTTRTSQRYPIVVDPLSARRFPDLREVWRYRTLIRLLGTRDIKLRFRQTRFGAAWLVVGPLIFTVGYAFLFGGIGNVKGVHGHSYFVYTYVGISLWASFNNVFSRSSNCLLANRELLTHVYFPRLSVPLASTVATQADVTISWVILAVFLTVDGTHVGPGLLLVPVWFVLAQLAAVACGLLIASWTIGFRDLQNIAPVVLAMGPIFTPIAYPPSALPHQARFLATLNPLTPLFDGMRASTLGTPWPSAGAVAFSVVSILLLLIAAAAVFSRAERRLADVI